MSLDFSVKNVKDYQTVTTAYRDHATGAVYFEADEHIDADDNKTYHVVVDDGIVEVHEIWHPVTEAIVWRTMSVGLGAVTEENIREFYSRSKLFDRITQTTPLYLKGVETHLTMSMLRNHIGLTTNVTNETRRKWMARIFDYEFLTMERDADREAEQLERIA